MSGFVCPLCKGGRLIPVATVSASRIIRDYRRIYGVDVANFFPDDMLHTRLCADCGLKAHHPARPGDSDFYDALQEHAFYYESEKPEFGYARTKITQLDPKRILEIGCGAGLLLRTLKPAYDVAGSEYSRKSIAKIREAGIRLDEPGDTYDFIMTFQVLEHVDDVRAFLDSAVAKLEAGGHLLITVPNNDSVYLQAGTSPVLDYPPHHMTQWTRAALENLAGRFGLTLEEYYVEPMRIEHFMGLLSARRNALSTGRWLRVIVTKLGRILDRLVAPYLIDHFPHAGHTHGVLLRKPVPAQTR